MNIYEPDLKFGKGGQTPGRYKTIGNLGKRQSQVHRWEKRGRKKRSTVSESHLQALLLLFAE